MNPFFSALAGLVVFLAPLALVPTESSCSTEGCNCPSGNGITVDFSAGIASSDVVSVTVTGSNCGTVPSPLCSALSSSCDPAQQRQFGWSAQIFPSKPGSCAIHVELKGGEIFDDTVQVMGYTGCCSNVLNGDHIVHIAPRGSGVDGGSVD